jgi:tellurite resistance protein TerC
MSVPLSYWIGFTAAILGLLLVDLLVLNRHRSHHSLLQSLATTIGWVVLAGAFGLWVTHRGGSARGLEFLTGYVIEYALSLDNIFIFVLIFASFRLSPAQQHRLLFWGVLGAMLMRGIMIGAGTVLLRHFTWVIYLFGAYLVYAGSAMLRPGKETAIEEKWTVRLSRRFLPLSANPSPTGFIERESGRWKFTLLFLVLVIIEATDLLFAVDSVPAVFGVTRDPFIVYTSNICAILGLRALYFLIAGAIRDLAYLHVGLAMVLIFIGAKMVGEYFYAIPTVVSLLIVAGILGVTILASLLKKARHPL